MNKLHLLDYFVFLLYFILVSSYGYWVYHRKKFKTTDTKDFFLAEGSLTWWAIGASLIASNISAEHFIGMSGSGFAIGLAISSYEWMSAATLILVAVFFIPIYLKNKIYTMPQFLSHRYNDTVATIMAVFWLLLYVFVNLTSILYLGSLAVSSISGIPFFYCMLGLALFSIFITLGGMKVIGYTDIIQVVVLVLGGLVVTYLALDMVSDRFNGNGIVDGLSLLKSKADDHFHMIFSPGHKYYYELPGMAILFGGMWINNLNYWGCNQYIVQRALGADLPTARQGILFAAFLKLLIPLICVIPGIAMYVLYSDGLFATEMMNTSGEVKPDQAYPTLMNLLPIGLKGISFAALTAAIVASLAGKCNSIATIFSLDIYKKYLNKESSESQTVKTGRWSIWIASVSYTHLKNKLNETTLLKSAKERELITKLEFYLNEKNQYLTQLDQINHLSKDLNTLLEMEYVKFQQGESNALLLNIREQKLIDVELKKPEVKAKLLHVIALSLIHI